MTAPVTRSEAVRPEPPESLPWSTMVIEGWMTRADAEYALYAVNSVQQLEADRARLVAAMKAIREALWRHTNNKRSPRSRAINDAFSLVSTALAEMEATDAE